MIFIVCTSLFILGLALRAGLRVRELLTERNSVKSGSLEPPGGTRRLNPQGALIPKPDTRRHYQNHLWLID